MKRWVYYAANYGDRTSNWRLVDEATYALQSGEHFAEFVNLPTLPLEVFKWLVYTEYGLQFDLARQQARDGEVAANFPSWGQIDGYLDGINADINASTLPAQAKQILRDIVTFMRKHARVTYWDIKQDIT